MWLDLFLVRHAEAIPRGTLDIDDHRWLTERGRRRFYRAARKLRKRLKDTGGPDAVLTSPLPRAVMTAELLQRALRLSGPLEVCAELAPGALLPAAQELLRRQRRVVAAVGHEPMLSDLRAALTGQRRGEDLPKGGVVWLRLDPDDPGGLAAVRAVLGVKPRRRRKPVVETAL